MLREIERVGMTKDGELEFDMVWINSDHIVKGEHGSFMVSDDAGEWKFHFVRVYLTDGSNHKLCDSCLNMNFSLSEAFA